jgi:hypothetical protein
MELFRDLFRNTGPAFRNEVQRLAQVRCIDKEFMYELRCFSQEHALHIRHPTQAPKPQSFPGIDISDELERDQLLLVLDYLQWVDERFLPRVLRCESQHPTLSMDRDELARKFGLRAYDRTPLLAQLVDEWCGGGSPELSE